MTTYSKQKLSVKLQAVITFAAILAAVAMPQILHLIGKFSGLDVALGELLLPMHFPVIVAGLVAGPYVGACVGFMSPIISTLLTGMPHSAVLPFMIVELFSYGLTAGILQHAKISPVIKTLIVQISGRLLRFIAVTAAVYLLHNTNIGIISVWTGITKGLIGIIIQLIFIPFIMNKIKIFNTDK